MIAEGRNQRFGGLDRPDCPKCGTKMMLARVEPDEPGQEKRTFECPGCNYSNSAVIKRM